MGCLIAILVIVAIVVTVIIINYNSPESKERRREEEAANIRFMRRHHLRMNGASCSNCETPKNFSTVDCSKIENNPCSLYSGPRDVSGSQLPGKS